MGKERVKGNWRERVRGRIKERERGGRIEFYLLCVSPAMTTKL